MRAELALAAALAGALLPGSARAYCRSTTCDPDEEICRRDDRGCLIDGAPLWWGEVCIPVWLPTDPEPLPGIAAPAFATAVRASFEAWGGGDCGDGLPSIDTRLDGALECALTGYDPDATQNVNTVRVLEEWPYPAMLRTRDIALTTVTFDPLSGEVLDADIEINADENRFSIDGDAASIDLQSALTHEAGHALGLSHSDVIDSTMFEAAVPGSAALRTLEADDVAAICEAYPPGQAPARACTLAPAADDPTQVCKAVVTPRPPPGGGCSLTPGVPPALGWAELALLYALALMRIARAHRPRTNTLTKHE